MNTDLIMQSLFLMLKGMVGIFAVMLVIYFVVLALAKLTNEKK